MLSTIATGKLSSFARQLPSGWATSVDGRPLSLGDRCWYAAAPEAL
jgi:hypothetical protein